MVVIRKRLLNRFKQSTYSENVTAFEIMIITMLMRVTDCNWGYTTFVYKAEKGGKTSYFCRRFWDGGGSAFAPLEPQEPSEDEVDPNLFSFAEASLEGKGESHPGFFDRLAKEMRGERLD